MFLSSKELCELNFALYKLDSMSKSCNKKNNKLLFAIAESDLSKFEKVAISIGCELDGFQSSEKEGELIVSIIYWGESDGKNDYCY